MTERKFFKRTVLKTFLRCFFAVMLPFLGVMGVLSGNAPVFADEPENTNVSAEAEKKESEKKESEKKDTEKKESGEQNTEKKESDKQEKKVDGQNCFNALGEIGWLVCPGTGKIANAVDWLYDKIESVLQINPIKMQDGEPIYEIWKYCRGITNIVFVIFMLIVIYSQITGVGISNYGLKKAMPKLIVAAVLVNLSFLLCLVLIDVSNIIGAGLRGMFTSVEQTVMASMNVSTGMSLKMTEVYQSLAGGTALAVGAGAIAFELGAFWLLIPVALGAIVAVVTGLITIALRQAVVMILIMISPLAVVAYILPNTEQLFERWKKLLVRMLVFYPAFSFLFGASSLAGFAIITGAKDGFGVLIGIAVQIFPLFFSWKLMRMSGTILGTINEKMRGLATKPMAGVSAWANSHRELSKQKHLSSGNVYTPSRYLTQFLNDRKVSREAETVEHSAIAKERGLVYNAMTRYQRDRNGRIDMSKLSREGEQAYATQARRMAYAQMLARDKNNFNKGFDPEKDEKTGKFVSQYDSRINKLNIKNVKAADSLFVEQARGEKIDYDNVKSRFERFGNAFDANQDRTMLENMQKGKINAKDYAKYVKHFDSKSDEYKESIERYDTLAKLMNGKVADIDYFGAAAAASYGTQIKVVGEKYQKYFELVPPTRDVMSHLNDLTLDKHSAQYIDAIVPGLRVLNQRGDTDLVAQQLINLTENGKLVGGTHYSQSVASFLMFDTKDTDFTLRRFGKYINLQTAKIFSGKRQKTSIDLKEYVRGEYTEPNGDNVKVEKSMKELLEGTPLDKVERTAYGVYDSLLKYAYDIPEGDEAKEKVANAKDFDAYLERKAEIDSSIGSAFISASMKYETGSEQLVSAVGFKSGYVSDKKGGMIGIWDKEFDEIKKKYGATNPELVAEKKRQRDKLEKFYRKEVADFINKQTSTQLLNSRTDYRVPLVEHLFGMFNDNEMAENKTTGEDYYVYREGWTDEMEAERYDLLEQYNKAATEGERDVLKLKIASAQLQNMLAVRGVLDQIHDSKRSGAANNAKDWLRNMVGLNDKSQVAWKLNLKNKKNQKKAPKNNSDNADADVPSSGAEYQSRLNDYLSRNGLSINLSSRDEMIDKITDFINEVATGSDLALRFEDLYEDLPDATAETIYEEFCDLLMEYFDKKQ